MSVPRLSQHQDLFTERNLFLHATLGVISYGQRTMHVLEHLLRDDRVPKRPGAPAARRSEVAVDAVLGVIGLWHRVERELSGWARSGRVEGEPEPLSNAPVPRKRWLR